MITTPRPPLHFSPARCLEMLVLAFLAFGLSLWFADSVFSDRLVLAEEGCHLFQAGCFLDGTHSRDPGAFAPLLRYPGLILTESDWLSRHAPGHAFWLVPGVWIAWPHLMTALASALTMAAMYGIGWRLRAPRFLLPALLLCSPFFLFLHGTLLPQTSGMAFAALLLMAYLKWRQERKTAWAFLSGLTWSVLFCIRPFTAGCLAVPFLVDTLLELRRHRGTLRVWMGTLLFVMAGLIGVWAVLRYNDLSTGDPLKSVYLEYEPSEAWGFGPRRTQGGEVARVEHSLRRGVSQLWESVRSADRWLFGLPYGTLLVGFGLMAHGWSRRWSGMLLGAVCAVLAGHVGFWASGSSPVGPLPWGELLPYVVVLGGLGLSRIWRRMEGRHPQRIVLFSVGAGAMLWCSVPFVVGRATEIREAYRPAWRLAERVASLPDPALVFLPEELEAHPSLFLNIALNPRGLESDVVRLQAEEEEIDALAAAFPEREPSILHLDPRVDLDPVTVKWEGRVRAASNSHHSRGTGENEGESRVAMSGRDQAGFLFFGWYPYLPPGEYECRFVLRWSGVRPEAPVRLEVMTAQGNRSLVSRVLAAGLEETALRFRLEETRRVEPRVYFGGSGEVTLRRVEIRPVSDSE